MTIFGIHPLIALGVVALLPRPMRPMDSSMRLQAAGAVSGQPTGVPWYLLSALP